MTNAQMTCMYFGNTCTMYSLNSMFTSHFLYFALLTFFWINTSVGWILAGPADRCTWYYWIVWCVDSRLLCVVVVCVNTVTMIIITENCLLRQKKATKGSSRFKVQLIVTLNLWQSMLCTYSMYFLLVASHHPDETCGGCVDGYQILSVPFVRMWSVLWFTARSICSCFCGAGAGSGENWAEIGRSEQNKSHHPSPRTTCTRNYQMKLNNKKYSYIKAEADTWTGTVCCTTEITSLLRIIILTVSSWPWYHLRHRYNT